MEPTRRSFRSRIARLCVSVLFIASLVVLVFVLEMMSVKTSSGQIVETHPMQILAEFGWIRLLVVFVVSVAAFGYGALALLREEREWRALERKYGEGGGDA